MEHAQKDGSIDKSTIVINNFDKAPLWFDDNILYEMTRNCSAPVISKIPGFRYWEVDEKRRMNCDDNITGDVQRAWAFYWAIRCGVQKGGICLELGSTDILGPATLGVDKHCGTSPDVSRYGQTYGYPHMEVDANEKLPFFDNKFEAVLLNHVIEHLLNPAAVLIECLRVVKKEGIVGIITPDMAYMDRMTIDPTHIPESEFSADQFATLIATLQSMQGIPEFDIISLNTLDTHFSFECVIQKR